MNADWNAIILDTPNLKNTWSDIFAALQEIAQNSTSPIALHNETVVPDRLLSEAAWELWEAWPENVVFTSTALKKWCSGTASSGRAVLILDALSLRELPLLLKGAQARKIDPEIVRVTGSECPSTTDQFAKALGVTSRSSMDNDGKPKTFVLFEDEFYTDVVSIPFEDCALPPSSNLLIWHSWLDDLIHLHKKSPDQIAKMAASTLKGDGFWNFVNKLRKGRKLVITSDHGYAVSKRFSSEVSDPEAVEILRRTFKASRNKPASEEWQKRIMPPIVMSHNNQHVVMGQWKWKVSGGFPHICHGGMSLLETIVPYLELPAL